MNQIPHKSNLISRAVQADRALLDAIREVMSVRQEIIDAGFAPGGANAFVDADFVGDNDHLDAATFVVGMNSIAGVDTALAANTRAGYKSLVLLVRS